MNILFLIGKYPSYGGTEKVTTVLANAFRSKSYRVCIASFEQSKPELLKELNKDIKLISLSYPVLHLKNIIHLRRVIKDQKIDLIINQWCLPLHITIFIRLTTFGSNIKLISVLHGQPDKNKRLIGAELQCKKSKTVFTKQVYKFIYSILFKLTSYNLRFVLKHSDRYVLLSESFKPILKSLVKTNVTKKLVSIGNPITIDSGGFQYSPLSKEKTIIYVGRMDYENKRVHRIVEIWENLHPVYPDWCLKLVGDGPEKQSLIEYAKHHNIRNIFFEEFKKEPPISTYKKASILLLTSELEGFGLVILEAMSFGVVPVVYGGYPAVFDIIQNKTSGIITPKPYNRDEMINAIKDLINNPDILNEMAKNAIAKSKYFSLETTISQWEELISQISISQ